MRKKNFPQSAKAMQALSQVDERMKRLIIAPLQPGISGGPSSSDFLH
jgi:hypothetical protein